MLIDCSEWIWEKDKIFKWTPNNKGYISNNGWEVNNEFFPHFGTPIKYFYTIIVGEMFLSLHREDGPAVEMIDGRKEWYVRGKKIN